MHHVRGKAGRPTDMVALHSFILYPQHSSNHCTAPCVGRNYLLLLASNSYAVQCRKTSTADAQCMFIVSVAGAIGPYRAWDDLMARDITSQSQ